MRNSAAYILTLCISIVIEYRVLQVFFNSYSLDESISYFILLIVSVLPITICILSLTEIKNLYANKNNIT
jgi:hypothetical protein